MSDNPVLIEVTRGSAVESQHRGAFVVIDAKGKIVQAAGNPDHPTFPRSSAKPLQALPLIETGAADRFGLGDKEIALACASHKGEASHVGAVRDWLGRIGLDEDALECGTQSPRTESAAVALIREGAPLTAAFHNCSGKHTGFLTTCIHCGDAPASYIEPSHPAQKRVTAALSEMTRCDLSSVPMGREGCGIPVYSMPLRALALGMARLVDTTGLPDERKAAAARILSAMKTEPFFVNGTGGFTTNVMLVAGERARIKGGYEGVYTASLPSLGLGVAIKIDDGAMRAAECAMAQILQRLGCFSAAQEDELERFLRPKVLTDRGRETGRIQPTAYLNFT